MNYPSPEVRKRWGVALLLRERDGLTFKEIGKRINVNAARAHQVYHIARMYRDHEAKKIEQPKPPTV